MSQKAQIKLEVEETVVLKQGGKILRDDCPKCGQNVDLVSPDVLALVLGASEREIFRLVESGAIHFVEAERLVVCPDCYHRATGRTREHYEAAPPEIAAGEDALSQGRWIRKFAR